MSRVLFPAATFTVMLAAASPIMAQHGESASWRVDGLVRSGIVFAPSAQAAPDAASPLVLSFHGHGDRVQGFQQTNLQRAWPQAVVVYLQGLDARDGLPGWQVEKGQDGDRDLKLVDVVLAALHARFKVDDRRIYATGFSNGANFTYLLWAERPDVFAAFAPVAARLRPSVMPTMPRPLLHIAGTLDNTIPFAAQKEAIETAKRVDGDAGPGRPCGDGCTLFDAGAEPVMTWIHPGGHQYPPTTSDRIAKFFRDHPRR